MPLPEAASAETFIVTGSPADAAAPRERAGLWSRREVCAVLGGALGALFTGCAAGLPDGPPPRAAETPENRKRAYLQKIHDFAEREAIAYPEVSSGRIRDALEMAEALDEERSAPEAALEASIPVDVYEDIMNQTLHIFRPGIWTDIRSLAGILQSLADGMVQAGIDLNHSLQSRDEGERGMEALQMLMRLVNRILLMEGLALLRSATDTFIVLPVENTNAMEKILISQASPNGLPVSTIVPVIAVDHRLYLQDPAEAARAAFLPETGAIVISDNMTEENFAGVLRNFADAVPWSADLQRLAETRGEQYFLPLVKGHEAVHALAHKKWPLQEVYRSAGEGETHPYPALFDADELEFFMMGKEDPAEHVVDFISLNEMAAHGYALKAAAEISRELALFMILKLLRAQELPTYRSSVNFLANIVSKIRGIPMADVREMNLGDILRAFTEMDLSVAELADIGGAMYKLGMKGMAQFDRLSRQKREGY